MNIISLLMTLNLEFLENFINLEKEIGLKSTITQ